MAEWQQNVTIILFIFTYWVMAAGRFQFAEWIRVGRTATALLCGIVLLIVGAVHWNQALTALNLPTLLILLALMLISAVFYCCGFYSYCALKVAQMKIKPQRLLLLVIVVSAVLSAWFANDIVAFAMTPMLCKGLYRRGIDARPYLYGLMGGCNAGSVATMIGSPQNIILAEHGGLPFWHFVWVCAPVAIVSVFIVYFVVRVIWRKQLQSESRFESEILPPVERNSFLIGSALLTVFILGMTLPIPRWITALIVCILVFVIFWFHCSEILRRVDWRLLGLFVGLFLVNKAFANTGIPERMVDWLYSYHLHMENLGVLTGYAFLGVNTIGKVPSTIFTLTLWPNLSANSLYAFAIMTGLAGNTLLISSLANIIVAERSSAKIRFLDHMKAGIPMVMITMAVAFAYLRLFYW